MIKSVATFKSQTQKFLIDQTAPKDLNPKALQKCGIAISPNQSPNLPTLHYKLFHNMAA
jgi:hypothetical protein